MDEDNSVTIAADPVAATAAVSDTTAQRLASALLSNLLAAAYAALESDRAAAKVCMKRAAELLQVCGRTPKRARTARRRGQRRIARNGATMVADSVVAALPTRKRRRVGEEKSWINGSINGFKLADEGAALTSTPRVLVQPVGSMGAGGAPRASISSPARRHRSSR